VTAESGPALPVYSKRHLQHVFVQRQVRDELLEFPVLFLDLL
jgi:hypothetical protein